MGSTKETATNDEYVHRSVGKVSDDNESNREAQRLFSTHSHR